MRNRDYLPLLLACWVGFVVSCYVDRGLAEQTLSDAPEESLDSSPQDASAAPFGMTTRVAWKNARLVGSPDPPLPYTTERVFESIAWDRPIYAKSEPGTDNLIVVNQGGEEDKPTRIVRIHESSPTQTTSFLKIDRRLVYGLEFDPGYEENGHVFIFSNGPTGETERKNRISRFQVEPGVDGTCDPSSEHVVLEWRSMGHDGGELAFGADGMLYISSGDGTSDSDVWLSAQDVTNLLGAVLRIDVRDSSDERPYAAPPDNPFVAHEGARPEIWAFGLRNPWRLWCDRKSGQIWVGNNGQDLWETAHLVRRGENYGWSVYEGSHPFYANRQRGPAEIVAPTVEHHHTEARSLTGGVVYRGAKLPELDGAYVYGDYATGKVWAVRHDGESVTYHRELADTTLQIAGFAISPSEDLLIVDHGGGLYRLKRSRSTSAVVPFPTRLSDTGLFHSTEQHLVHPGVVAYSVNAPGWNDHAVAHRYLAVPDDEQIAYEENRGWNFPNGSVLMQTLEIPEHGQGRRIETRLLVRWQNEWAGYAYRWNQAQTDAFLAPKQGEEVELSWRANDGATRQQSWHIPSRAECMSCHSRAVNFVLGLSSLQMNRLHAYENATDNQLRTLKQIGLLKGDVQQPKALVNPYDKQQDLDRRARSYLHTNCSSCHVEAGGGNARMQLEFTEALDEMSLIGARPQHATFGIENAVLVAPGEPDRSVLASRVSRRGSGQMPPLFSNVVDEVGAALLREWIASLPATPEKFVRAWSLEELQPKLTEATQVRQPVSETLRLSAEATYTRLGCIQCHRLNEEGGGAGPDLSAVGARLSPTEILESIVVPSKRVAPEYAGSVIVTTDGRTLEGRIEHEGQSSIRLRPTESFSDPITISKSDIEERTVSRRSMMPSGMLNACTEEEALDLLLYLSSCGTHAAGGRE